MKRLTLVAFLAAGLLTVGTARTQEDRPRSSPARVATAEFEADVSRLDEEYRKKYAEVRAAYAKAMEGARQTALEKKDLDEAQRILETVKKVADEPYPRTIAAVRSRVANSSWVWHAPDEQIVTFHGDGTMTMNWAKGAKGFWHVNPDLTVVWWTPRYSNVNVMRFNRDFTAHDSYVPDKNLPRSGRRLR